MPRPCAVESHVRCYKQQPSWGCHGLVPWRFTLEAAVATRLSLHGTSPWHLKLLENQLQADLHVARQISLTGYAPEVGVGRVGFRVVELDVVEGVQEFASQLEFQPLEDPDFLQQGDVP